MVAAVTGRSAPRVALLCLVAAGCATPPPPPAPTAKRLALSQAQEVAIKAAITPALSDVPNPVFPLLAAATETDGSIYVCGTAKPEAASYQDATPFALLMKGAATTILAVGGNERDNQTVKTLCASKGIDGFSGLKTGPRQSSGLGGLLGR